MPDFIPRSDVDCLTWSAIYVQGVAADPARVHVSADNVAALLSTQAAFAAAMAVATSPGTRTPVAIVEKNAARLAMEAVIRLTANSVRSAALRNDPAMLTSLGLAIGPGRNAPRRVIGPPKSRPSVFIRQVQGAVVTIQLHNVDAPSRRGLARGISGATLFSYVGAEPPVSIVAWRMHRMTSRTDATLDFGAGHPAGTQVWISAQWTNLRQQASPLSTPVYAHLGYTTMDTPALDCVAA